MKAIMNGQNVVAILDTGSSGVVSESCFWRLGLIQDGDIEFTITLSTDKNQKTRKIVKELEV